ncbi:hypothetical protein [Arthrobacter sp. ISL-28]|uniref:hypothetical protein n=1 Tax=Arthrobacter sp. ISL-28 TaxID=2819108 RepID=UPI001BEC21B7|nr:hypothetical protein [Arthrobacter sp. ISL-28]MBT2523381.1 hypothetical protein [Arthrobacter sp. ISL-28]
MSQEQPPIRSRRELRRARDEAQEKTRDASATGAGEVAPATKQPTTKQPASKPPARTQPVSKQPAPKLPADSRKPEPARTGDTASGRIRRVAPGPVDSVPASSAAERSSQIRARDRAALRTIKELAEKEGQLSGGGPPTRRQLRLMQLEQAVTSAIPVVPPAGTASAPAQDNGPAQPASGHPQAQASGQPHAAAKAPAKPKAPAQPQSPAAVPAHPHAPAEAPAPPQTAPKSAMASEDDGLPHGMTVEQALGARALIAEQAKNQIAKMEHIAATDPEAVDPEILAQQIALAERAAILNKRALAKQKLAEKNTPQQPQDGPSTASNLAMVTPLEFVQVPGVDRPVMKRPATSYVPVVTNPGPRIPSRGTRPAKAARPGGSTPSSGRARVIARAEAAARAASEPASHEGKAWDTETNEELAGLPPVAAKSAYGLEPLDAATAGLARAHRLRLLQLGVLALGAIALITGIIMIISGLSG